MADPSRAGFRIGNDQQFCHDRVPAVIRGGNCLDSWARIFQRSILLAGAWVRRAWFVALPVAAVDWEFVWSDGSKFLGISKGEYWVSKEFDAGVPKIRSISSFADLHFANRFHWHKVAGLIWRYQRCRDRPDKPDDACD